MNQTNGTGVKMLEIKMDERSVAEAMRQITLDVVVKIPRLSTEEIDIHTRPRKRVSKKRYHFLSFDISDDEEDEYFEMAVPKEPRAPSRRRKRNCANSNFPENSIPTSGISSNSVIRKSYPGKSSTENLCSDVQISSIAKNPTKPVKMEELKPLTTTEVKILKKESEEVTYTKPVILNCKDQKVDRETIIKKAATASSNEINSTSSSSIQATSKNSLIGKIRIKTAAELGSSVLFLDSDDDDNPPLGSLLNGSNVPKVGPKTTPAVPKTAPAVPKTAPAVPKTSFSVVSKKNGAKNTRITTGFGALIPDKSAGIPSSSQSTSSNMNIKLIADLYAKFFTPRNQTKIRSVAEVLQNIAENIKNNNERLHEINSSKSTDAEKLMKRCVSYQDFRRKQEESQKKLCEKFQLVMDVFDDANFETLFQLFFLGILKILIISVSNIYKKGSLFKKLLSLLTQSLASGDYKNERVFELLKSKDFRDKCITLVQFIEKYSKTEFFGMLFLSEDDKKVIRNKSGQTNESVSEDKNSNAQNRSKPAEISEKEHQSFLLNLLKESKAIDIIPTTARVSVSTNSNLQQNTCKTYAPALRRNVTATNTAPFPASNSIVKTNICDNTGSTNGIINNFVYSGGQVRPAPNSCGQIRPVPNSNVINIQTNGTGNNIRIARPSETNHLNRTADSAPANPVYHLNASYNKVHNSNPNVSFRSHINGLNGTISLSTSNGNIENIQPGSYVNPNNNLKKPTKDNSWTTDHANSNGLRSLLTNDMPNNSNNFSRYLEQYGASNLNLNAATKIQVATSLPQNDNTWIG